MKDIKSIISKNLLLLRKDMGITQAELAEKFNYSDKAVCRWECGDTLPDINVLYALCEFYGITMNDLVDDSFQPNVAVKSEKNMLAYRLATCLLLATAVWLFATVTFVYSLTLSTGTYWLAFIWAIPITCVVILRSMKKNIGSVGNIIVSSILSWSTITALFLHVLVHLDGNIWYIFLVGIPLQAFILQLFIFKKSRARI